MATFAAYVEQLLADMPKLGFKFTGTTSSSAATVTTTNTEIGKLAASQSADRYNNWKVIIPSAAAAADQERVIAAGGISISAATTTITLTNTSNYGETLSNVTMFLICPEVSANLIFEAGNDSLEYLFTDCWVPLRHGPDSADMQGSSVDADWTESVSTDTVQTTASEVFWGVQSLVVTNAGYTASGAQRVGQGRGIQIHGVWKSDTGESILQVVDASSNVQDYISSTEEQWTYGTKRVDFDSGEETFTIRLTESGASDSGDWQGAWYVRLDEPYFVLPSWIDARFKIKSLSWGKYLVSLGSDLYLAGAVEMIPLNEGQHFYYSQRGADANPNAIFLTDQGRQYIDRALYLIVTCPWSAPYGVSTTFTAWTSTSSIPQHTLTAHMEYLLGQRFPEVFPGAEARGLKKLYERVPQRSTTPPPHPDMGGPREI